MFFFVFCYCTLKEWVSDFTLSLMQKEAWQINTSPIVFCTSDLRNHSPMQWGSPRGWAKFVWRVSFWACPSSPHVYGLVIKGAFSFQSDFIYLDMELTSFPKDRLPFEIIYTHTEQCQRNRSYPQNQITIINEYSKFNTTQNKTIIWFWPVN